MARLPNERVLGPRCYQVLNLVHTWLAEKGRAPSYSEIRDALDIGSKSEVGKIVKRLEKRRLVTRVGRGRVRRIRLG